MGTSSNRSSGTQVNQRGVTQGTTLVDPVSGFPVDVITETDGIRRLAVDADITADSIVVDTRDLNYTTDNVAIKGSTGNELVINSDGSINSNLVTASSGSYVSIYNSISAVASGVLSTISSYTVPSGHSAVLQKVAVSGDNIAIYSVILNSFTQDQSRTYFGGQLNSTFDFSSTSEIGLPLQAGDQVTITVIHSRPYTGDFNARIQVVEQ